MYLVPNSDSSAHRKTVHAALGRTVVRGTQHTCVWGICVPTCHVECIVSVCVCTIRFYFSVP